MNDKLLVTRPEFDTTTFYLSQWCKKPIDYARKIGIEIIDLQKEKADRSRVGRLIETKEPHFIIFNGHGDETTITGHKNEILIKAGVNEAVLKSTITYAISCSSARELGPAAVKAGAIAYIGYDDDFVFVFDKNKTAAPLKDDYAKMFLEPSNEMILALIKGNSVEESYKRSQQSFQKNIKKLLTSESPPGSENHLRYLFWDMKHQAILGDKGACF